MTDDWGSVSDLMLFLVVMRLGVSVVLNNKVKGFGGGRNLEVTFSLRRYRSSTPTLQMAV